MKRIGVCDLAVTYAGCFLGAGFVSGQEIRQFFAQYGTYGICGLILATVLLYGFGVLALLLIQKRESSDTSRLIVRGGNRLACGFFSFAEAFLLLGVGVIMTAGAGALFEQLFGFSSHAASLVFCIGVYLLLFGGAEGMVRLFSITVPFLVMATAVVCVLCLRKSGDRVVSFSLASENFAVGRAVVSAVLFAMYNLFCAVGILAPLGKARLTKRTIFLGTAIGCVLLFLTAAGIYGVLILFPALAELPLPMLAAAAMISPSIAFLAAALMLCGILGTAVSSLGGALHIAQSCRLGVIGDKNVLCAILCTLCFVGSRFGFDSLIGTIYPGCGCLGTVAMCLIAEHSIHIFHIERKKKSDRL